MPSVLSSTNGLQPIWLLFSLITLMNETAKLLISPSYCIMLSLKIHGKGKTRDIT